MTNETSPRIEQEPPTDAKSYRLEIALKTLSIGQYLNLRAAINCFFESRENFTGIGEDAFSLQRNTVSFVYTLRNNVKAKVLSEFRGYGSDISAKVTISLEGPLNNTDSLKLSGDLIRRYGFLFEDFTSHYL